MQISKRLSKTLKRRGTCLITLPIRELSTLRSTSESALVNTIMVSMETLVPSVENL